MRKFKYKTVKTEVPIPDSKLNIFGRQGWELCGVCQDTYGYTYYIKKEIIKKDDGKDSV